MYELIGAILGFLVIIAIAMINLRRTGELKKQFDSFPKVGVVADNINAEIDRAIKNVSAQYERTIKDLKEKIK